MKILPLEKKPWIQAYHLRNYELGILQEKKPWVYNKYINIYYDGIRFGHVMPESRYFELERVMDVQRFRLDKSIFSLEILDFVSWFSALIEDGWYIYVFLDDYYIEAKISVYHKTHFRHTSLIYGVDEDNKLFYAIGYIEDQKYKEFTIPFEDFRKAISTHFDRDNEPFIKKAIDRVEFDAFRINPAYKFEFNLKEVYLGISDYLNSCNPHNRDKQGFVYGINCEHSFIDYVSKSSNFLDPRFSRFFMEMKDITLRRLEYLSREGYISTQCRDLYAPLVKKQNAIHMLFLKYNIKQSAEVINRICDMMEEIIADEERVLRNVKSELFEKLKEQEAKLYCLT